MAKIHWLFYIAVGLFVSISSWRLNYEKLIFFFYIGLFFILIGILKLIFSLIKTKMSKKEKVHHKSPQQHVKYCHNCGAALRHQARFCTRCGAKV
ncbi:zinc ribbon domain-containing protein [Candidatus Woesearchaeota archaeon]|nr:zinc ribbon domain-containing protein [Candidatus Woesearchaeota archaeon]